MLTWESGIRRNIRGILWAFATVAFRSVNAFGYRIAIVGCLVQAFVEN